MKDPFQELNTHLLYEIEVEITDEDIRTHQEKLDYLSYCRDLNIYPGEE